MLLQLLVKTVATLITLDIGSNVPMDYTANSKIPHPALEAIISV